MKTSLLLSKAAVTDRAATTVQRLSNPVKSVTDNRPQALAQRALQRMATVFCGNNCVPIQRVAYKDALKHLSKVQKQEDSKEEQTQKKITGVDVSKAIFAQADTIDKTKPADIREFLKEVITSMYPGMAMGGTRIKYPLGKAKQAMIENKNGISCMNDTDKMPFEADNEDDKILQELRWISSSLYEHLQSTGYKNAEEVQALWNGEKIFIAANDRKASDYLKKEFKKVEDFQNKLPSRKKGDISKGDTYKRENAELQLSLEEDKNKDIIINALQDNAFEIVVEDVEHAELKLVRKAIEDARAAHKKSNAKFPDLYVAGVRFACCTCYVRLLNAASDYEGDLHFADMHGFLWLSENAWTNTNDADLKETLTQLGVEQFCESVIDGEQDNLCKFTKNHRFVNLNGPANSPEATRKKSPTNSPEKKKNKKNPLKEEEQN